MGMRTMLDALEPAILALKSGGWTILLSVILVHDVIWVYVVAISWVFVSIDNIVCVIFFAVYDLLGIVHYPLFITRDVLTHPPLPPTPHS